MVTDQSSMASYSDALRVAVHAAQAAGGLLREEFHRPGTPYVSDGGHSLDAQAERLIRQELSGAFPDWGYRGEETGYQPTPSGSGPAHLWLVDPNDGTDAFLAGLRSSAVSIALLRDGKPVLGVVYAFAAPDDDGDLFAWAEGCAPLTRNGRAVQRPPWPSKIGLHTVILVSEKADRDPGSSQQCVAPGRFRTVPGIAYRLALVAAGEGDAGVSFSSPCGWDYAGGHALLLAVGGTLLDESGRPVTYLSDGSSGADVCIGGAPSIVPRLCRRSWRELGSKLSSCGPNVGLVRLEPSCAVRDAGLLRRAQGALLGQLAGDALGILVEFTTLRIIRKAYPESLRLLEDGGAWKTVAGQPIDGELALTLARSIVARKGYDENAAASGYVGWLRSGPFDVERTTSHATGAVTERDAANGKSAERMRQAALRLSESNGSLVRASRLGIFGYGLTTQRLADLAKTDSGLTHPNPMCREACASFVVAVAHVVATGEPARKVYEHTLAWAEKECRVRSVRAALKRAGQERAAVDLPADIAVWEVRAVRALENAFYQLLNAPSFEDGVVRTVAVGGDTATNGAIAGALLGAVYGRDAVPTQWRQMVLTCRPLKGVAGVGQPRPEAFWPVDALELAERLLLACPSQPAVASVPT